MHTLTMREETPTEEQINVDDSIDARWAVQHFLGRTADEMRQEFEGDFGHWVESLMFIGPVACAYYGRAAIDVAHRCLSQDELEATDCDDVLRYLLAVFEARRSDWNWDVGRQHGFTHAVVSLCLRVERDCDPRAHSDLRRSYRRLREKLERRRRS